ncbi:hypothetical protein RD792_004982 [Penstemon davidsonii]|uniref:Tobamovirus multiplication protein 2A n=1 Tax=Penstemon davidsonii TaxID=160366 RepID=A0ABR0DK86_9LAMI|nr:hypothetical protein RD792_004982 [Penstemon davidsonii]
MACKGFWECLLKILNFLLILVGLAMIGYGIYLFVEYKQAASAADDDDAPIAPSSGEFVQLGRPMLLAVSLGDSILDKLPKACIYTEQMLPELCILSVIVITQEIPTDKTGNFDTIYQFLEKHWKIIKWVALGTVILEALLFLLALVVRAVNKPADYDSDEEYIGGPGQQIRQPLINRPAAPAAGVPVAPTLDQRPSRNDAWSARMREKYGLDTSEFTYNPSESNRYPQAAPQSTEEKKGCVIM